IVGAVGVLTTEAAEVVHERGPKVDKKRSGHVLAVSIYLPRPAGNVRGTLPSWLRAWFASFRGSPAPQCQADAATAPGNDRDLTSPFLRQGTPPLPLRAVRVKGCKTDCLPRGIPPAGSRRLYQAEQALCDDLPHLLHQLANDLTGGLD